ncbi:MAG: (d)CMP kinase [Dehalococcoidia bacterium]
MPVPSVIAIDGPVASGKTTVGRLLAQRLGYRFIDTGLYYRAMTSEALGRNVGMDDSTALGVLAREIRIDVIDDRVLVDGRDVTDGLRSSEVEAGVSRVSRLVVVRHAMVSQQQREAEAGDVVMVGRDIGTKVLPDAAKVYLEAPVEVRVKRRRAEFASQGRKMDAQAVRDGLEHRDKLDTERAEGPLRVADDAIVVDTQDLDAEGVVDRIIEVVGS